MNSETIAILGNGGAAVNAVMAARTAGFTGKIHQVSDSPGPAFNPMLAPYYLKGMIPWRNCFPYGGDFYQRYDVIRHFGSPVETLDTRNKSVLLKNGKILSYDRCLIATGASPLIPPVPGLKESSRALTLRTPEDTIAIEQAAAKAEKVVIMGASLVGVKLAEIFKKRGVEVILLDIASRMLPQGSHPEAASFLKEYFIMQGVDVRLGCSIDNFQETEEGVVCPFPEGIEEEASFAAVCTGIRPNIAFIDRSEVDIDRAILVDEKMCTNVEGLFAAGDACQGMSIQSGKREWLGTWGNACYQGRTAGFNMAGMTTSFIGTIPQHISPLFDWTYAQMGDCDRKGDDISVISEGNPFEGAYRLLVYDRGVLIGANLINCAEESGIIKNEIFNNTLRSLERKNQS